MWTSQDGITRLGRATNPVIGVGAGGPEVSEDGLSVSASILTDGGTLMTPGIWKNGSWTTAFPPIAPDGILLDSSYGSAWGLSGDGEHVVGFHWCNLPGQSACPMSWSSTGGTVAYPTPAGSSSRLNAASYDGSVVVGWEELPFGTWVPRAWRNGVKHELTNDEDWTQAFQVTSDGAVVVGYALNTATATREATYWTWNGVSYDQTIIGKLPGTVTVNGFAQALGITNDGSTIVGHNSFTFAPYSFGDGWIWTQATGMIETHDYLTSLGLSLPLGWDAFDFTAISGDGYSIVGGMIEIATGALQSFVIRLEQPCDGDANGDGTVDVNDISFVLFRLGDPCGAPGCDGDANNDGVIDVNDISYVLFRLGNPCGIPN
jgi:uncharacterized membrane protein